MSGIATLPIENPVLIFFIVLVIILFADSDRWGR